MPANSTVQDVFRFTTLRAPKPSTSNAWYRVFARNNYLHTDPERPWLDRDITDHSQCLIGAKLFAAVSCQHGITCDELVNQILALDDFGVSLTVMCDDSDSPLVPVDLLSSNPLDDSNLTFIENQIVGGHRRATIWKLPNSIPLTTRRLDLASSIIETHIKSLDKPSLVRELSRVLEVDKLSSFVVAKDATENNHVASEEFRRTKDRLFDLLYFLYVAKRRFPIDLESILRQIRTIHVIEFLAYDDFSHQNSSEVSFVARILQRLSDLWYRSPTDTRPRHQADRLLSTKAALLMLPNLNRSYIDTADDLRAFFNVTPVVHPIFSRLQYYLSPFNDIRPVGIADLKIVKQLLVAYEPGEVAHIENVLKGESKERFLRRLDVVETFESDQAVLQSERSAETQTTDRFELQREVQRTINEQLRFNADATVHYDGPVVDATLNAGFAWEKSTEEGSRTANNFAKEVVVKTAERLMQQAMALRTTRRTSESEETNRHGLNNTAGSSHAIGIYRYVNKRYKAQVFNYGARLMFEFMIPEPAEYYRKSVESANQLDGDDDFECTIASIATLPERGVNESRDVTPTIVGLYEKELGLQLQAYPYPKDIERSEMHYLFGGRLAEEDGANQPAGVMELTRHMFDSPRVSTNERDDLIRQMMGTRDDLPQKISAHETQASISVTLGAKVRIETCICAIAHWGYHKDNPLRKAEERAWVRLKLDDERYNTTIDHEKSVWHVNHEFPSLDNCQLPLLNISANCDFCQAYFVVVKVIQTKDPDVEKAWQDAVYAELQQRIKTKNAEIERACAKERVTHQKTKQQQEDQNLVKVTGRNPEINRIIVREELHKHALTMFAREFDSNTEGDLLADDPISYSVVSYDHLRAITRANARNGDGNECSAQWATECRVLPEMNIDVARRKGEVVQFFEQAFEWDKISFLLYPYFYGDRSRWMDSYVHFDNVEGDPEFVAFLRAGFARVLVPVRDQYRDAAMHFLQTREVWNGGSAPVIGDSLYLAIHQELRDRTDEYYNAVPDGEPWEYSLPTSLMYLQSDDTLPVFGSEFPSHK